MFPKREGKTIFIKEMTFRSDNKLRMNETIKKLK